MAVPPGRWAIDLMQIAVPIFGGIAIIFSALSILYRENWRLALYGTALGSGAMLFLYLWWLAVLVVACVIIISIIENIGDIFGGFG